MTGLQSRRDVCSAYRESGPRSCVRRQSFGQVSPRSRHLRSTMVVLGQPVRPTRTRPCMRPGASSCPWWPVGGRAGVSQVCPGGLGLAEGCLRGCRAHRLAAAPGRCTRGKARAACPNYRRWGRGQRQFRLVPGHRKAQAVLGVITVSVARSDLPAGGWCSARSAIEPLATNSHAYAGAREVTPPMPLGPPPSPRPSWQHAACA